MQYKPKVSTAAGLYIYFYLTKSLKLDKINILKLTNYHKQGKDH